MRLESVGPHLGHRVTLLVASAVAAWHFVASVAVAPAANVVFQRWFDTGERASGVENAVLSLDRVLATPVPAWVLLTNPVYPIPVSWWVATGVNSVVWGLFIYMCYVFGSTSTRARTSKWLTTAVSRLGALVAQ